MKKVVVLLVFKSYSYGFPYDSGFPTGLNGRKYRFFYVGRTVGGTFWGDKKHYAKTKCV